MPIIFTKNEGGKLSDNFIQTTFYFQFLCWKCTYTHLLPTHRVLHVNKIRIDWLVREFLDVIETSNQNFLYASLDEQNVERASTIAITTHRAFILPL